MITKYLSMNILLNMKLNSLKKLKLHHLSTSGDKTLSVQPSVGRLVQEGERAQLTISCREEQIQRFKFLLLSGNPVGA